MKQRNHAFDLLCGICILRMVSLHTMQICGHANDAWWAEVMQWSYFFMSFFFFKAGYFNKSVTATPTRAYVRDKAKRLLVPYLSAGLIGTAVYFAFYPYLTSKYGKFPAELEWSHVWTKSDFYGNPPTWFLFSFFCAYVLIHLCEKTRHWLITSFRAHGIRTPLTWMPRHWSSLVYLTFPLIGYALYRVDNPLWFSLSNVFMGVFFFELGRAWRRILSWLPQRAALYISIGLIASFIVGNFLFHDAAYTMSSNRFDGDFLPVIIHMVCVLCGLSGLLITLGVRRAPVINYIGEHSMVFFVGHFPILFYYKYMHLTFGRSIYGRYDDVLILLPAVLMICAWLVPFVERYPVLSGRWKK